jgi:hypothetical protein
MKPPKTKDAKKTKPADAGPVLNIIHPETGQVHAVPIGPVRNQEEWDYQVWPCIRGYVHADGKLYLHDKKPMTRQQFENLMKMLIAKRNTRPVARPVPANATFGDEIKPVPPGSTFGPPLPSTTAKVKPVPPGSTFGPKKS